jgi:hypothetical protein
MKKIWLFILLLVLPISVFARSTTKCDYTLLSKLKKYASNVNIIYDYKIVDNEAYFNVTINNIVPDIYIIDEITGSNYSYDNTNNGELVIPNVSGVKKLKYKIMSHNSECSDELLLTQYIKLPVYNKYSNDPLCDGMEGYKLCYTFLDTEITYEEFKKKIEEFKKEKSSEKEEVKEIVKSKSDWDKFLDFMIKYGIYTVGALAIIITILSIRRSRKNQFDFKL